MGNLSTPDSVQKLQTALHAKAKAEPGYRFYALYDKISREDILAHAYAQCRSNKGAPGVDRQDFEAIEAYGVERWLGELALALRRETYRPEPRHPIGGRRGVAKISGDRASILDLKCRAKPVPPERDGLGLTSGPRSGKSFRPRTLPIRARRRSR